MILIGSLADLTGNDTPLNPVLPVTEWPIETRLPNGESGNHYLYAEFSQPIDVASVLDSSSAGQANFGLLGTITVLALDPGHAWAPLLLRFIVAEHPDNPDTHPSPTNANSTSDDTMTLA